MSKLIRTFTVGSCGLHIPQSVLIPRRFINYPFGQLGFRQTPFALSSGAAIQLYDFCVGKRSLPERTRLLAYMDKNQPVPGTRDLIDSAEIVLLELSTPIEPMIGDDVVNFNRVAEYIRDPLRNWGVDPRIINNWSNALFNLRDDFEERRDLLLANWPKDAPDDDGMVRFGVESLWCRRVGVDEMVRDVEQLRHRIDAPILLKLFDFQYMPDGRAIDWPAGFKKQQIEIARQMNLPTLDVAPIVAHLGARRLIAEDMMHWRAETSVLQAYLMYDALADVLDRPRLSSYAEASGLRREMEDAYPELDQIDGPASFPGVVQIPTRRVPSTKPRVASTSCLLADELADRLNWALIGLHRRRLNDLGLTESGLGPHYKGVIEKETLVGLREERVLDLLSRRLPPYDAYAVMRAGLGELALLIAASGRRVIAYEPYATRRTAIEAGRTYLENSGLLAPGALTLIAALIPATPLEDQVLGIGLDVVHFTDEAAAAPHLGRLTAFEAMLIDPRIFLRLRRHPEEQAELARQLCDVGFDEREDFPGDYLCWFYRSGGGARRSLDPQVQSSA